MRLCFLIGSLLATACVAGEVAASTVILRDDFAGPAIDASIWSVYLPFSASAANEVSSGSLTITGRATISTKATVPDAYVVSGVFTPLDGFEHFELILRSDFSAVVGNTYATRTGIHVIFSSDGSEVSIQQFPATSEWSMLSEATFHVFAGKAYAFAVTDTGSKISVSINGSDVVAADTTFRTGSHLGFSNREFSTTSTRVDNFLIITPPPTDPVVVTVPDTSPKLVNVSTLGRGGFTLGFYVSGTGTKKILVRGIGPGLRTYGVTDAAAQTTLTVYSGQQVIAQNSGWSKASNADEIAAVNGPFPLTPGSGDSAVLVTLPPGGYTAQVTGSGAALVEAYEVP